MRAWNLLLITGVLTASFVAAAPVEDPPVFLLKWGSFGQGPGQFRFPYGLATDAEGNVYVADHNNNRIQKFTNGGVFIRQWGSFGSNAGQLVAPIAVAVSPDGLVYVADYQNDRIQVFTSDGVFVNQWNGGPTPEPLVEPAGIAVDVLGNVYVTERNRIRKFTHDGVSLGGWGSSGSAPGEFLGPVGIAIDGGGNVYVADTQNSRIQKFTSDGAFITSWLVNGIGFIATDAAGNVYGTHASHAVKKFSPTGTLLAQWGEYGTGDGQFQYPNGVAVDPSGNVFVAQPTENLGTLVHQIQKFGQIPVATVRTTWGAAKKKYR